MSKKVIATVMFCCLAVFARPLKSRMEFPPITPGEYVAQVKGDLGNYTMIWTLNSDSSYFLQMKTDSGQPKDVKARGKYYQKNKAVNFWNTEQETKDGWTPLALDPFPILEQNDTSLVVKIVTSEACFIRKLKKK